MKLVENAIQMGLSSTSSSETIQNNLYLKGIVMKITYSGAILEAFNWLLNDPKVFVIGQGLWSPWYVGDTMKDLDKHYGKNRIIDTPVSELGTTGLAVGARLGTKPIVVHRWIFYFGRGSASKPSS